MQKRYIFQVIYIQYICIPINMYKLTNTNSMEKILRVSLDIVQGILVVQARY